MFVAEWVTVASGWFLFLSSKSFFILFFLFWVMLQSDMSMLSQAGA